MNRLTATPIFLLSGIPENRIPACSIGGEDSIFNRVIIFNGIAGWRRFEIYLRHTQSPEQSNSNLLINYYEML
jgi:hypothetical protein